MTTEITIEICNLLEISVVSISDREYDHLRNGIQMNTLIFNYLPIIYLSVYI